MFSALKAIALFFMVTTVLSCQSVTRQPNQEARPPEIKTYDRLVDYSPYKYEVLFTDPECGVYKYKADAKVKTKSGKTLLQKPENVYCKNKYDQFRSGNRPQSPQFRLIEWINDGATQEIFFTYLSFRNKVVKAALCAAAQRGVKIKFVMSSTEDKAVANELVACSPENVEMKARGMEGGLGYAHNKFFIVNPNSDKEFKVVFSSGNMTSGVVIHHENWNFITTHPVSNFAKSHLCAMNAEWDEVAGRTRKDYMASIRKCRDGIAAPEEKDIKVFFVPGEGEPTAGNTKKTAVDYLLSGTDGFPGINNAKKIWIGCHRFLYSTMLAALKSRMTSKNKPELRIVADDDTYYNVNDPAFSGGDTQPAEWFHMENLAKQGAKVKLMETNSDEHQLHHSKYLIFADDTEFKAVLTGSANLTGAAFKTNWENTYYVMIPEVVKAFADHYEYTWTKLATAVADLPATGNIKDLLEEEPIINKNGAELGK